MFAIAGIGCSEDGDPIRLNVEDVNVTTPEDTPINASIDVDSNRAVNAMIVTQPMHGTVTTTGSGEGTTYTYTPELDYTGTDAIVVAFTFGQKSEMATINITITPVNDAPQAGPDSFAANFETPATFQTSAMLSNDTDNDSTSLSITAVSSGLHGTVTLEGSTVRFVPEAGYNGPANFTYTLSDGTETARGDVTVAVGNNTAPVAVDDSGTTMEDTAVSFTTATLLANDTDAENQTLSVIAVGGASNGSVSQSGSNITFTPTANFSGNASFTYTVADGAGADVGTVTIAVSPVNDAPIANPDVTSTGEDTPLSIQSATLLANDTDIDPGDTLTVTSVDNPTNGSVAIAGSFVTFTPATDFSGTASFQYTISDGSATSSSMVTVTVGSANDAPVAVNDTMMGPEDSVITLPAAMLAANDTDPDGNPLSVTNATNASVGSVALVNGNVSYTPPLNFNGTATFEYVVSDGSLVDTGTVTVTVLPVNDAPNAVNDNATTNEDTAIGISVLANDGDVDGPALSIMSNTQPANGTVAVAGGIATYTPAANFFGTDSFTYVASDGAGGMSTGTVTITVLSVNDAPVAVVDNFTINEDVTSTLDVRANDTDVDGNPLTLINLSTPSDGTVTIVNNAARYVPPPNFNGVATFTYTISDGAGGFATAMVSVTVLPVPDPAIAVDDTYSLVTVETFTVPASVGVMVNDQFIDGGETVELVSTPQAGSVTLNPDGSFEYEIFDTCALSDSFTYRVMDGGVPSNIATVTFDINHQPETWSPNYSTQEEVIMVVPGFNIYGSFQDSVLDWADDLDGDVLTAALLTGPSHASSFTFDSDGGFEYTPMTGYTGEDSFTYTVSDGVAAPVTETAYIFVYATCGGYCYSIAPADKGDPYSDAVFSSYLLEEFEDTLAGKGCFIDFAPSPSLHQLEASDTWWR